MSQMPDAPAGQCFRCGYDLRGIADDQPCPECGLLAMRSRRLTEKLQDTRPRWLHSISRGVKLILLSIVMAVALPFSIAGYERLLSPVLQVELLVSGFTVIVCTLVFGVFLLTRAEGYAPADDANRRWRFSLRFAALLLFLPLVSGALRFVLRLDRSSLALFLSRTEDIFSILEAILWLTTIALIALFLFFHLRAIAKRARSAHLAEHCAIVGIGVAVLVPLSAAGFYISNNLDRWLGGHSIEAMDISMLIATGILVFACLFLLWSVYLLVRFSLSFARASRRMRRKWKRDDRSLNAT